MKKTILKLTSITFLLILLTPLLVLPVFAQNFGNSVIDTDNIKKNIENRQDKVEDRQNAVQQNREERKEQICENIQNRISNKLGRFESNKSSHVEKYNELKQKLEEIVASLKDKGFDTSELEAHLAEFDQMIKDYAQSYVTFIEELENSQENVCGQSEGAFKQNMEQSRSYFKIVVEKRREIRKYYAEVIREDIKNIRAQAREMYEENAQNSDSQEE